MCLELLPGDTKGSFVFDLTTWVTQGAIGTKLCLVYHLKLLSHYGTELKEPVSAAWRQQGLGCSALGAAAPSLLRQLIHNHNPAEPGGLLVLGAPTPGMLLRGIGVCPT